MHPRRLFSCLLLAIAFAMPARAAVVITDYPLRGSLLPAAGSDPLIALGGQITALGYVFADNAISLTTPNAVAGAVSLEFAFTFRIPTGELKAGVSSGTSTLPGVYNIAAPLALTAVTPGTALDAPHISLLHVVLSRDEVSGTLTGYVNGSPQFTVNNAVPLLPSSVMTEFAFSLRGGGTAELLALDPRLEFVRVYNGPLTSAEVNTLFAAAAPLAIPEPSTYLLLTGGLAALFWRAFRRKTSGKNA